MATQAELRAIAKLDGRQFKGEVGKIGKKVKDLGKNQLGPLKGIIAGAFSIGVLVAFGRKMLTLADDMATTAKTFDLTMESIIAMKTVMAESGIQTDKFLKILGALKATQGEVIAGAGEYVDAIEELGISQEEFVGLGVDKLLELIARRYNEAGGSAKAFNGITGIFGRRIGVTLIEVFKRMQTEGLDGIIERTKDAADGMTEMAKASDALEKAGNTITLWAAKAVGAISKVGEVAGELFEKRFGKKTGILEPFTGEIKIAPAEKTSAEMAREADLQALADRKSEEAAKKKASIESKAQKDAERSEKERLRLAEKRTQLSKKQDDIIKDSLEREQEILAGRGIVTPERARVDALQAIGGLVGGVAGGDQAERRFKREMEIQEAIQKNLDKTNRRLDEIFSSIKDLTEG